MTPFPGGEMSAGVKRFFYLLEVITWLVTTLLTIVSLAFIVYQLTVLFVPYWRHRFSQSADDRFPFPEYFYRVYGDDVAHLNYEHYGYLVSACIVSAITSTYVVPNHPLKNRFSAGGKNKVD